MKHINAILNDRQATNLQLLFTTAWIDAKANESESLDLTTEDIDELKEVLMWTVFIQILHQIQQQYYGFFIQCLLLYSLPYLLEEVLMITPNWQHHSDKQPKYKKHVRIIQAAKKRTKQLIKKLTPQWP